MNVFYNLADPHSRSAVFSPTTQQTGDRNSITLAGNTVYTFPITGNRVFFSLRIRYLYFNNGNIGYNSARSGFFTLYNSDDKIICTIGWPDVAAQVGSMIIKAYNDAGTVTKTTLIPHPLPINSSAWWPGRLFTFYVGCDPVTGKKRLTLHYMGVTFGEIYDDDVSSVTNVTLGKVTMRAIHQDMYTLPTFSDIIVTDTENYAMESVVVKPATLHASNQFTGVVGSMRVWAQDRAYISNSSELNVTAAFTISPPYELGYYSSIANSSRYKPQTFSDQLYDVVQYDQYFMGRYIQDGGSTVSFTGYLKDVGDADLIPSHIVTVTANQDDTTYLTRLVSKQQVNMKFSALLGSTVKYVLTGA